MGKKKASPSYELRKDSEEEDNKKLRKITEFCWPVTELTLLKHLTVVRENYKTSS